MERVEDFNNAVEAVSSVIFGDCPLKDELWTILFLRGWIKKAVILLSFPTMESFGTAIDSFMISSAKSKDIRKIATIRFFLPTRVNIMLSSLDIGIIYKRLDGNLKVDDRFKKSYMEASIAFSKMESGLIILFNLGQSRDLSDFELLRHVEIRTSLHGGRTILTLVDKKKERKERGKNDSLVGKKKGIEKDPSVGGCKRKSSPVDRKEREKKGSPVGERKEVVTQIKIQPPKTLPEAVDVVEKCFTLMRIWSDRVFDRSTIGKLPGILPTTKSILMIIKYDSVQHFRYDVTEMVTSKDRRAFERFVDGNPVSSAASSHGIDIIQDTPDIMRQVKDTLSHSEGIKTSFLSSLDLFANTPNSVVLYVEVAHGPNDLIMNYININRNGPPIFP